MQQYFCHQNCLKFCSQISRKAIVLCLGILAVFGFIINTHLTYLQPIEMCSPKMNIVFLKTHKCAGSSIQNILMRYGDNHRLNFVLPRTGNYLGQPSLFSSSMVPPPKTFNYNILAHHTRLDFRQIMSIMPQNSVFITILRDPVYQFESSFYYYGFDKVFKADIHRFARLIPKMNKKALGIRLNGVFGRNQMLFDLGADPAIHDKDGEVMKYIAKLDSWFDLVMISERMDESLILMRHLLCWDINDVVGFKLNALNPKFKSNLSIQETKTLQQYNHADALLYNYFLEKFDQRVKAFGEDRMAAEKSELQGRIQNWYDLCIAGEQPHAVDSKRYFNPRVMSLKPKKNVTNSTCDTMSMEELKFTDYLRDRQVAEVPGFNFSPIQIKPIR